MSHPPTAAKTSGAALVMGAGIAGMQAALDLAESGFYVYLVERSPSIGGVMARLDKTFPTNDCAMCILSPKLVECGRHLNIEVLTHTEVADISGSAGDFRVKLVQHPRFVDLQRCTGCGDCEDACPVKVKNEYEGGLSERKAVYRPFPQAYPNAFSIEKGARAACQISCPAGVHAQGYVALIREGKFSEAVNLVKRNNPLPAICGRVCHHPCEENCRRALVDDAVAICALKRFVADYERAHPQSGTLEVLAEQRQEKVAIIGSGPAGLTAAHFLALAGFPVTIFEALPVAGGMLAVGIPDYRLPRDVLETEIDAIRALGVEIRTSTALGRDFTLEELGQQGYRGVFLALGAHRDMKLNLVGEEAEGVLSGVDFLREANLGHPPQLGRRVVVVGGGNVAIDAARSALRLGAQEVSVLYRRTRKEMPAAEHEVEAALHEGVKLAYLSAPEQLVVEDGKLRAVICQQMELGSPDNSGRRRPVPVEGAQYRLDCDQLIVAIGQNPDTSALGPDPGDLVDRWGRLVADPVTLATPHPGIFSGGDAVTGPDTVIWAIAAGRRAARSLERYLNGEALVQPGEEGELPLVVGEVPRDHPQEHRQPMPELDPGERVKGFSEVELGFDQEAAQREAARCLDCGICAECLECERVCRAGAISHGMQEVEREVQVGAVILTPGFGTTPVEQLRPYGYDRFPNVVTSMEFERILSASGPYGGHVSRPSDGQIPRRIAFIQCVGSRDVKHGAGYCSSVCCMYAIKEAVIAKEHASEPLDITIFYMDIRAYGKDFEQYYLRARDEHGVRFQRGKVFNVEAGSQEGSLRLSYANEDDGVAHEEFDLVVLSIGLTPQPQLVALAESTGLALDEHGYLRSPGANPVATSWEGVFAAGAAKSPKDIPETVVESSAAAAAAARVLAPARWSMIRHKEYPPERAVLHERPRVGVFVCQCGINIGGVVRVPDVADYARTLPYVVHVEDNLYTCSQDTQDRMKELIEEHQLNRIVVASCSPRTHEALFQETIREGGLNPYLFEMANIRDQCSWVHMHEPGPATAKAKDLVRMAVAKAALLEPLYRSRVPVTQKALVIGGGVAGMTAALGFAEQGFPCYLVEKADELGGRLRQLTHTLEGDDLRQLLAQWERQVLEHPLIELHLGATIESIDGYVGNFTTRVNQNGQVSELDHGVILVAIGGGERRTQEYLYGQDARVLTSSELERRMEAQGWPEAGQTVVMIGCAGSRQSGQLYCSRVCCQQLVKNALAIKEADPSSEVFVLYRDMRAYGLKEDAYRRAREAGVTFLRYAEEHKPQLESGPDQLEVVVYDAVLGAQVAIAADQVVLATGVEPPADGRQIAQLLKVPLNQEGFFLEAHAKLRPVDFSTDGVFVAGLAHGPKTIAESIAQAQAAVSRAVTVIAKDEIEAGGPVAVVNPRLCSACGACEEVCQYQAVKVNAAKGEAEVEATVCKGCGSCAATCRCGAITLKGFTDEQILAEVVALT